MTLQQELRRGERAGATVHRAVEVLLGIVLAVIGLSLVLVWFAGVFSAFSTPSQWTNWLGVVVVGLLATWCIQTAWRLLTGRERPGGGLLSPVALTVIGVVFAAGSVALAAFYRPLNLRFIAAMMASGLVCFSLARTRLRGRKEDRHAV